MKRDGTASDKRNAAKPAVSPPLPPTATLVDESIAGEPQNTPSSKISTLMTEVVKKENLKRALERVKRNKGAPGIDGMTVDELSAHLKAHWPGIRAQLVAGSYCPQPVRRVEIPKPDARKRLLGIPTVVDRFIQQALAQVVQRQWAPHFHPNSYGFRPGRNAHQAMRHAQATIRQGYGWVVDIDLEAFFDRVNHDRLMVRVRQHVDAPDVLKLINRFLKGGVQVNGQKQATTEGVPQGGPLSPVLANVILDELDWALERRGHRLSDIVQELKTALTGWKAYFGIAEVLNLLREIDKWVRRRLRCYAWKQWGSAGYRELRKRGVSVREAWNTSKSAHGPWRLSQTPALNLALPAKLFRQLGLPELAPAKAKAA